MLDALHAHVARRAPVYLWMLVGIAAFGRWFALTLNVSDSLPGTVFLVQKGTKPDNGQLAAFRYAGGGPYERGALFLKQMLGVPGSLVIGMDISSGYRDYFVDGQYPGQAEVQDRHAPRTRTVWRDSRRPLLHGGFQP
jgi:conjugal transfer pilin signal peptidase TrbI